MIPFARIASPLHDQPPPEVVIQLLPGGRTEMEAGPSGWRSFRVVGRGVDVRLRDTAFADGDALLARIHAWKQDIVALLPKGPTVAGFRLHRLVGRARHIVEIEGFQIGSPAHMSFAFDYARLVFGAIQIPRGLVDSEARWIVDANGQSAPGAGAREVPEARARRKKTIALLAGAGLRIPEPLSLVESEREALLCTAADAKLRALALWRTFRETCGAPDLAIESAADVRAAIEETTTAREHAAIASQDRNVGGAGVESLWALRFVLGAIPQSGPLGQPCNAETAMNALDELTRRGTLDGGELRPLPEILDALDQHQCLVWALAEGGGRLPAPMNGHVVRARLRALRWSVLDQFADWDDVALDA